MAENERVKLEERYTKLKKDRTPFTDRAEEQALVSIPYVFVEDGHTSKDYLNRNYTQGFIAQLVNNLVGKLALTILPPSQPFFSLLPSHEALATIMGGDTIDQDKLFIIQKKLSIKEDSAMRYINKSNFRKSLYPALRQAVVNGSCMVEKIDDDKYKVINLRNYVTDRDYSGTIVEMIIEEQLNYETLPEEFKSKVEDDKKDEIVKLYTSVKLNEEGVYVMTSELFGEQVGEEQTFKEFTDRFIDITWNRIDDEDYGRAFIEDHMGTIIALEKLTKVVYEGIAESVRIIKLVDPNGTTKYEEFVEANHGDAIIGRDTDITTVQSGKNQDLMVAKQMIDEMKQELSRSFLMTGASVRDSERTTAREVDLIAQEAEATLGGFYTHIADSIQRTLAKQGLASVDVKDTEDIDVVITTGLQALGRSVEMNNIYKMIEGIQTLGSVVGQEGLAKLLNANAILSNIVINSGVASKEFMYSPTQIATMEANAKQEMLAQQALMSGMQSAGQTVGQNIGNQTLPQGQ